jgi:uncharacterized damage-inducible protein DinB
MNEILLETFRHNAWATKALIRACRSLSLEQLGAPGPGFGSIVATLNHIVRAEAAYTRSLTDVQLDWANGSSDTTDLEELTARVDQTLDLWERLLAGPLEADRMLMLDGGRYECAASVVFAQALHHANAHREQIRSRLGSFGATPPDLQAWTYALDTGRARRPEE